MAVVIPRIFQKFLRRRAEGSRRKSAMVYLYIKGVRDEATLQRLQDLLARIPDISTLVLSNRSGCAGLYCRPDQVLEITMLVGTAGYSVAGVQFLGHGEEPPTSAVCRT
jgi:hypothetical protein